jgi:hypothetical protein
VAGTKYTSFSAGDPNATAAYTAENALFIGFDKISLTSPNSNTVANLNIAAGSKIECNGALYHFETDEAISTTDPHTSAMVANGYIWVMLIPAGDTISAVCTATAPSWSASKQGWYGTTTYANNRYISYKINKTSDTSFEKIKIIHHPEHGTAGGAPILFNLGTEEATFPDDITTADHITCGSFTVSSSGATSELYGGLWVHEDITASEGVRTGDSTAILWQTLFIVFSGESSKSVAHYISNALTNNRIRMAVYIKDGVGAMQDPSRLTWDNTNITLTLGSTTGTFKIYVVYV